MTVTDPAVAPPPAEDADRRGRGPGIRRCGSGCCEPSPHPRSPSCSPALATAIVLVASGNSPRDVLDVMTGPGLESRNIVNTLNRAGPYYLVGRRRRHRVQDEPLQHRRRGPVPAGRAGRRGVRRRGVAARTAPRAVHPAGGHARRRRVGRHRRRAQGVPRRERGDLDDHAQRHRRRAGRASCSATGCARPARRRSTPSAPGPSTSRAGSRASTGRSDGSASTCRRRPGCSRTCSSPSWSGSSTTC